MLPGGAWQPAKAGEASPHNPERRGSPRHQQRELFDGGADHVVANGGAGRAGEEEVG